MNELLIAEAAEEEYTATLQWYAERSKQAAEGFEAEFAQALQAIQANPERYPLCDDDRHRFYLLKRYPLQPIYRKAEEGQWLIIAVAHTSRKPGYCRDVEESKTPARYGGCGRLDRVFQWPRVRVGLARVAVAGRLPGLREYTQPRPTEGGPSQKKMARETNHLFWPETTFSAATVGMARWEGSCSSTCLPQATSSKKVTNNS